METVDRQESLGREQQPMDIREGSRGKWMGRSSGDIDGASNTLLG